MSQVLSSRRNLCSPMVLYTRDRSRTTKDTGSVFKYGLMEPGMKDSGVTTSLQEEESSSTLMVMFMMVRYSYLLDINIKFNDRKLGKRQGKRIRSLHPR